MSGNNPPTDINIMLSSDDGQAGFATLYIQNTNSDGTAPSLALAPPTPPIATFVQPVANTGGDADFPASQYPWVGVVQAGASGTGTVQLSVDGVLNQSMPLTVSAGQNTVYVPQSAVVVTPPT